MSRGRVFSGAFVGFALVVVCVVLANVLTVELGVVPWLGVTAGTFAAGLVFLARDYLHEMGGVRWVLLAIVAGAVVSALFSPRLAVASVCAFVLAELADLAVYAPLRESGRVRASHVSNVVGAFVDTVVFLWLAGFPLSGTPAQVAVKFGVCALTLEVAHRAVSREPVLG